MGRWAGSRTRSRACHVLGLVQAAVAYYGAYHDEIDEWIELNTWQSETAHAAGGEGHAGMVIVPTSFRLTRAATGQIVAALEATLAEYPGEEDLANDETWI